MSAHKLTPEQTLLIEAVAAQLHDRDETSPRHQLFWPMVDEYVKQRYRNMARRKLKTGEIDGWYKYQPAAKANAASRPSRERYNNQLLMAAE